MNKNKLNKKQEQERPRRKPGAVLGFEFGLSEMVYLGLFCLFLLLVHASYFSAWLRFTFHMHEGFPSSHLLDYKKRPALPKNTATLL